MTPITVTWHNEFPHELDDIYKSIQDTLSSRAARLAASYEWHILDWLCHHKARRIYIVEWTTEIRTEHSIILNRNCKYFEYFERGDAFRFARELRNDGLQALVKIFDFKWLLELSDDQFEFLLHTNPHNKGLARKYRAIMKEAYDNYRHTKADGPIV
jgi:hypothetical protein